MGAMLEFTSLHCPLSQQLGSSLPQSVQDKFSLCLQHTEPLFSGMRYVIVKKTWQDLNLVTQKYTSNWLCKGRKRCYITFFLPSTIKRGCWISWLSTHFQFCFFFKSQNIYFPNSCCPFLVLCSLECLGVVLHIRECYCTSKGWQGFLKSDEESTGTLWIENTVQIFLFH